MDNLISEIISEEAFRQVERLQADLKDNVSLFEANVKSAVNFNQALKGVDGAKELNALLQSQEQIINKLSVSQNGVLQSHKSLIEIEKLAADLKSRYNGSTEKQIANMGKLADQTLKSARASELESKETLNKAKAKTEEARATEIALRTKERENKINRDVADGWKSILNELRAAENAYKSYAAAVRAGQEADSPQKRAALLNDYNKIRNYVDDVDSSLRIYNRNVGNYSSAFKGLTLNTQQLLREMPALAINANTFFLAISNNLPMFFDSIQAAKEEIKAANAELKVAATAAKVKAEADALAAGASQKSAVAAGVLAEKQALANAQMQKTPSIGQMLVKSLFSVNSLLTIGVTLLTLFGGKIIEWVGSLIKGRDTLASFKKEQEEFAKAQESANKSAGEQIGKLTTLNAVLQSNTTSAKAKKSAYDEIVKMYPAYQSELEREYRNTGNVANIIKGQLIPALIAAAKARAMQSRIDDIAAKNLGIQDKKNAATKEEQRLREAANEADKKGIVIKRNAGTSSEYLEKASKSLNDQADNQLNKFKELHKEQQLGEQVINSYSNAIVDITPKIEKLAETTGAKTKKAKDTTKDFNKELENQIELLRKKSEKEIERNKILGNTAELESARTRAMQLEVSLENQVFEKSLQKKKLSDSEKEILEIDHQKKLSDIRTDYLKDIASYDNKRKEQFTTIEAEMTAIATKESEARKENYQQSLNKETEAKILALEVQRKSEEAIVLKKYQDGLISREEYENEILAIRDKYESQGYNIVVDSLFKQLFALKGNTQEQKKVWDEIEKLQKEHEENKTKKVLEEISVRENAEREARRLAKDLYRESIALIYDLGDAEIQRLDDTMKSRERQASKEKEMIEASGISEKEKSDLITALDKKVQAEKEAIERKQRKIKREQAIIDKAQAIANVTFSTIQGVARAFADYPSPYSAIVAALTGALGAVQIARAVATPLPAYKDGRKGGKAEFALVGEAGTERIEHADGRQYYVDKPTITYLPEHAKVIPNYELQKETINKAALSSIYVTNKGQLFEKNEMVVGAIKEQTNAIKEQTNAVRNSKPSIHINRSWKGETVTYKDVQNYIKWINDNI